MLKDYNAPKSTVSLSLLLIIGSCLSVLIQYIAMPYGNATLISLSNRALLVLWIVVIGMAVFQRLIKPIPGELGSLLLIVIFSSVSWMIAVLNKPSEAISNALRMAGFLIFPLMLAYKDFFRIDDRAKSVVYMFNALYSLVFIFLYHTDKRHAYEGGYGLSHITEVTLGYSNPNQAAMFLFLCVIGLVSGIFYTKSKYMRLFLIADGGYLAWIMLQTESRATILLFAAFIVLSLLAVKREISRRWINFAFMVPLSYVLLLPLFSFLNWDFVFLNETFFNGREKIFLRYFDQLNVVTFLLGDMNTFAIENLHNGYIAISASAGALTCVSYVKFLRSNLVWNRPTKTAPVSERIAFVGFLCAVMYTCAEAAFFVGGSHYAFLLFSLFVLFARSSPTSNT